jgi:O-antigen ligase
MSKTDPYEKNKTSNLVLTDYLFLFGMTIALCWAVDPFNWLLEFRGFLKHLPLVLTLPAFILTFIGTVLFKKIRVATIENKDTTIYSLIFGFSVFVIIGSLYARFVSGIENGFLTMGLYALMGPLTAWFISRSPSSSKLIKYMLLMYLFWALAAIFMQFVKFGELAVFHSREHLALAGASLLYFLAKTNLTRFLAIALIGFGAYAGHKNTAYMVALLQFFFFFMVSGISHVKKIKERFLRWMFWFKSILLVMVFSLLIAVIYFNVKSSLPDGNPGYRMHTYEIAWNKFLSSPIWGNAYTRAATEEFDLFHVAVGTQVLPTHSDPLDIMANGGLIGLLLWASIYVILIKQWYRLIRNPESQADKTLIPYIHASFCLTFSGLLVCMFNPLLNSSPNNAWAYWAIIGVLLVSLSGESKSTRLIQKN